MTNEQIQALKVQMKRKRRDWTSGVMRTCDYCGQHKYTVTQDDGSAICAPCCDTEHVANLENIAETLLAERDADKALIAESVVLFETLRQRIAELEREKDAMTAAALAMRDDMREARTLTVKLPDSIPCPTAPEIIWLQTNGDDSDESKWPESDDDVSWCREKIFTNDTLYVRADLAAAGITLVVGE